MDHPHAHYMLTPDELIEKLEAERAALVAEVDRLRTQLAECEDALESCNVGLAERDEMLDRLHDADPGSK